MAVEIVINVSSVTPSFWNYTTSDDSMVHWLPVIFWKQVFEPPSLYGPTTYSKESMTIEDLTSNAKPQIHWSGGATNNQHKDYESVDLLNLGDGGQTLLIWFTSFNNIWVGIPSRYVNGASLDICK